MHTQTSVSRLTRGLAALLALQMLLVTAPTLLPGQPVAFAHDSDRARGPWYTDLNWHWAEPYVRTLWREGVTPPPNGHGSGIRDTWDHAGPFKPDGGVLPGTFADMLARMFPGDPFVPPDLSQAPVGGLAGPALVRQDAVRTLVWALGLKSFAETFDPDTAATYLRQFRDAGHIHPDHRQTMALAVFLGIIKGYPDHTLRPQRTMTRGEGAAVLYRSCLLLTEARPNPFSPDGDGAEDSTTFLLGSLLNRNAQDWDFFVLDASGQVLRRFKSSGIAGGAPPPALAWAGLDDQGRPLPPGTYYYQGWLRDRNGLIHWSVNKPIILEAKSLLGFARPAVVLPGGDVELTALASGGPSRVSVSLSSYPQAGLMNLAPHGTARQWERSFRVPDQAAPGPCVATFTAWYRGATRTATATFTVGAFRVDGELIPNPVPSGKLVEVVAWPNLRPDRCLAVFDLPRGNVSVELSRAGRHGRRETWGGTLVIPAATPPGFYAVTLVAERSGLVASRQIWLEVTSPADRLAFILTD